jgi:hypothetical protein
MLTLDECLVRWREAVEKTGKPPAEGPPVLLEAALQVETAINTAAEQNKSPWRTQVVSVKLADSATHESERVEKMRSLMDLVGGDSRVYYVRKAGDNESPHVCIGRAKRNDIVLGDNTVSSVHARVEYVGEGLHVADLKSSNGTFVNGKRLGPESAPLFSGDCLRFGRRVFYYLGGERMAQLLEVMARAETDLG